MTVRLLNFNLSPGQNLTNQPKDKDRPSSPRHLIRSSPAICIHCIHILDKKDCEAACIDPLEIIPKA